MNSADRAQLESRVLGTILASPWALANALFRMRDVWSAAWTSRDRALVAAAIMRQRDAGRHPDHLTVRDHLLAAGEPAVAALCDQLLAAAEDVSVLEQRAHALAGLTRIGQVRGVLRQALEEIEAGWIPDHEPWLMDLQGKIGCSSPGGLSPKGAENMTEYVDNWLIERAARRDAVTGVPTGFGKVDAALLGLQAGTVNVLGARPSHGKTAIAVRLALHAANHGHPVIFFSHEMSAEQIYRRLACCAAEVSLRHATKGVLLPDSMRRLQQHTAMLRELPLVVFDEANASPMQCRSAVQYCLHRHPTGKIPLVIVDYLQLEKIPGFRGDRQQEVAECSLAWKTTCKLTGAAGLILSQLNRQADGREPRLADLRESGALEQDAHATLLLWRPNRDRATRRSQKPWQQDRRNAPANMAFLDVAKNRDGDLCDQILHFRGYCMRFDEWTAGHIERASENEMRAAEMATIEGQLDLEAARNAGPDPDPDQEPTATPDEEI